eukprot:TRINITY_DN1531_c0_g1_i5.p1 TRINITY_DN1531_c0_g1~~TRINITY_DN1531_c0_g1_i5.p1  ORF type:complete len:210 (+),score=-15.93 TRINITY_DN1531_c0_g1_i5:365-994(+)
MQKYQYTFQIYKKIFLNIMFRQITSQFAETQYLERKKFLASKLQCNIKRQPRTVQQKIEGMNNTVRCIFQKKKIILCLFLWFNFVAKYILCNHQNAGYGTKIYQYSFVKQSQFSSIEQIHLSNTIQFNSILQFTVQQYKLTFVEKMWMREKFPLPSQLAKVGKKYKQQPSNSKTPPHTQADLNIQILTYLLLYITNKFMQKANVSKLEK